jgi:hypothetical protein
MQTTEAAELVRMSQAQARHEGRDLWELMEERGRLVTETRARQIKSEALSRLLYVLDSETAERVLQRYLGGRPATAQDMFDGMLEWLKDYKEAVEAGHVE